MAVGHSVEPQWWRAETDRLLDRMAGRFARVETRRRVRRFVLGLLADLPRMRYLLARASWDTDGVRDDLRDFVVGHLGDNDGVLVVDETGDVKKGSHTVGVQHQYTGTAGRIENAQVAVCLTYSLPYSGERGHAMIDRGGADHDPARGTRPTLCDDPAWRDLDGFESPSTRSLGGLMR